MADYFFSELPNILPFEGTGIGYKSIVKLKVFAQPMHRVFVIKYCILLKTSLSEEEWVTGHKYGFHADSHKLYFLWLIGNKTSWSPIRSVVITKYDWRPNWTPLGPITITD